MRKPSISTNAIKAIDQIIETPNARNGHLDLDHHNKKLTSRKKPSGTPEASHPAPPQLVELKATLQSTRKSRHTRSKARWDPAACKWNHMCEMKQFKPRVVRHEEIQSSSDNCCRRRCEGSRWQYCRYATTCTNSTTSNAEVARRQLVGQNAPRNASASLEAPMQSAAPATQRSKRPPLSR